MLLTASTPCAAIPLKSLRSGLTITRTELDAEAVGLIKFLMQLINGYVSFGLRVIGAALKYVEVYVEVRCYSLKHGRR